MVVTFLGTRANIPIRSAQHRRHSAMLLSARNHRVLIDCGEDWLGRFDRFRPTAVLLTHGHPDHTGGLKNGAPCPVYATRETWGLIGRFPIAERCEIPRHRPVMVGRFIIEAWPLQHSLNAPAVGFKIFSPRCCLFYAPDVAALQRPRQTLQGVDLYIGDGAVVERSFVRRRGAVLIGHASVATQVAWCGANGVADAIFTHCGSGIVRSSPKHIDAIVRTLGRACDVRARVAHDGLRLDLRRH